MLGYDAWKLACPYEKQCEFCGATGNESRKGWQPQVCTGECGIRWRDPDAEYEAMKDC
jgi:hypothetical protein